MSIKRRIMKLAVQDASPLAGFAEPLCHLLGAVDSLLWPHRAVGFDPQAAAVAVAQRGYFECGLEWTGMSGGGSSRAWKSDERLRAALAAAGLIEIVKSTGNLPYIRPRHSVMDAMRRLLHLPHLGDVRVRFAYRSISEQADCPDHWRRPGGWCGEAWLFASDYETRPRACDWFADTETLLPLLMTGVIESRTSTAGHVFFRSTGRPLPRTSEIDVDPPEDVGRLMDIYDQAFIAMGEARRQFTDTSGEVFVPLSATA